MDISETQKLERVKQNALLEAHFSLPARVISFDRDAKTARVEIMLKMVDSNGNQIEYPPLEDCPCKYTRGGGFHAVHPYKEGDSGFVVFSDRCIDGWFESGLAAEPMDYRIHSMSDAYFLGGVDNLTNISPIIDNAMFIGKDDNSAGLQINSDGSLVIKGTSLLIEPPTTTNGISNTGSMGSTGNISTDGNVIANGKPLDGHDHGGVQSGNSRTEKL